jgi:acetyl esterase/lipase
VNPSRSIVAVAIALLMLAVAMWTIVPAPTSATLVLAVLVPELALPLFIIFGLTATGLWCTTRGRGRAITVAVSALALAALAWPAIAAAITGPHVNALLRRSGVPALRAHAPVEIDVSRDVPVPLRDGTVSALDFYRPRVPGALPLIVTIYGGGWRIGSRAEDASLARWYATRGYAVAVIDYRHTPSYRFPIQIDDVEDALATIARHASTWHVDRERVALFGRSAGAQLALLAGERVQALRVRAIVAYYAPTDLAGGWENPPRPDPGGIRGLIVSYLGGPPDVARATLYRAAAPLANAHAGMPAVLAIIGDRDELVRPQFQRAFASRLTALHVRNVAIELPWSNHAFDLVPGLGSAVAHAATLRFLDALLLP